VLYSGATATLKQFVEAHRVPLAETQAGKSSLPADHPLNMGAIGANGSSAANTLAEQADVVLAVERGAIIGINTQLFDATKHCALSLVGDADVGLKMIAAGVGTYRAPDEWVRHATGSRGKWLDDAERVMVRGCRRQGERPH